MMAVSSSHTHGSYIPLRLLVCLAGPALCQSVAEPGIEEGEGEEHLAMLASVL